MKVVEVAGVLSLVFFIPHAVTAQVYSVPTPSPQVTAASAPWQTNGEPIPFAGSLYYPIGPTVFFNGNVMVRSGIHNGVPIYTDSTLEANSIIFVPVGANLMRPYERKRAGQLAGTVGSRMPSFPIERDVEVSARGSFETPDVAAEIGPARPAATAGSTLPGTGTRASEVTNESVSLAPGGVRSIPPPQSNAGIWIELDGGRWRRTGAAVAFSAARFTPAGDYRGFPVYRDRNGDADHVYIPAVPGGPLVPYSKR